MTKTRRIRTVRKSEPTIEGAGVHLRRAFGHRQVPQLDPFLLLDDFHSDDPSRYIKGFPWHPHRGIETITYMLHGEVEHGDSMGNKGLISAGDVQWMTAGSGIVHQEMPKGGAGGLLWGFQLWANLPRAQKMVYPRYRDVKREQIPLVSLQSGVQVRVIAGEVAGVRGPVRDIVIHPEYLDVTMPPEATFVHGVQAGHTVFAYTVEGRAAFGPPEDGPDSPIGSESLVIYEDGDEIRVSTAAEGTRFLLLAGKPIGEPVAWYGPIVMNTQEELEAAFQEYQQGTFLKHQ
jgi:redox-sensitive bicupin YhaK (pirin superfamily)